MNNSRAKKSVLLLQGPYGGLFKRLSHELIHLDCDVYQVAFNGGDEYFSNRANTIPFRAAPDKWSVFLCDLIHDKQITDIVCFSDCRLYHRQARKVASELGLKFWVLEEGYLRPNYFTLEPDGVNAHSAMFASLASSDGADLLSKVRAYEQAAQPSPYKVRGSFKQRMNNAIVYYVCKRLRQARYPAYAHHRVNTEVEEGLSWLLSGYRKLLHKWQQRHFLLNLEGRKIYTLILQMHEDFQLREHSPYSSMTEVINEVMTSFAEYAPQDARLVIKHHPIDRGFHHYGKYIAELEYSLNLSGRIDYVHDVHLPTLLKASQGVVTVNSTVGVSALVHNRPVKVLGQAIYDLPGLCFQGELNAFWQEKSAPEKQLVDKLVAYLRNETQINGCLHKDIGRSARIIAQKLLASAQALDKTQSAPLLRVVSSDKIA